MKRGKGKLKASIYTNEFLNTLGVYVYMYKSDDRGVYYVGKGVGRRCLVHVEEEREGFDIDDLYIVIRNTEVFDNSGDSAAHMAETLCIHLWDPSSNKISGRYKENIIMAKMSDIRAKYAKEKYNNFGAFPEWYINNMHIFEDKINTLEFKKEKVWFKSIALEGMTFEFSWYHSSEDEITVSLSGNSDSANFKTNMEIHEEFLDSLGYVKYEKNNESTFHIKCINIDTVVKVFEELTT